MMQLINIQKITQKVLTFLKLIFDFVKKKKNTYKIKQNSVLFTERLPVHAEEKIYLKYLTFYASSGVS